MINHTIHLPGTDVRISGTDFRDTTGTGGSR